MFECVLVLFMCVFLMLFCWGVVRLFRCFVCVSLLYVGKCVNKVLLLSCCLCLIACCLLLLCVLFFAF